MDEMYSLVGIDGNAYSIMGYVQNAMKKEGKSREEIQAYLKDAQSSDYSHLLSVSHKMIEELND